MSESIAVERTWFICAACEKTYSGEELAYCLGVDGQDPLCDGCAASLEEFAQ